MDQAPADRAQGWVLGGTLSLGFLEAHLSDQARREALKLLQQAQEKASALWNKAVFFEADQYLKNTEFPQPQTWYAWGQNEIDLTRMGWLEKRRAVESCGKKMADIVDDKINARMRYVHGGDDFVHIETNEGKMSIRWTQHVVAYYPPVSSGT